MLVAVLGGGGGGGGVGGCCRQGRQSCLGCGTGRATPLPGGVRGIWQCPRSRRSRMTNEGLLESSRPKLNEYQCLSGLWPIDHKFWGEK